MCTWGILSDLILEEKWVQLLEASLCVLAYNLPISYVKLYFHEDFEILSLNRCPFHYKRDTIVISRICYDY